MSDAKRKPATPYLTKLVEKVHDQNIKTIDRVTELEKMVNNGLADRTIRIEQKLDKQDERLSYLIDEIHHINRRVDAKVDKGCYEEDQRAVWENKDRRHREAADRKREWIMRFAIGSAVAFVSYLLSTLLL